MTDSTEPAIQPASTRPSIALTTPFLSLAAAVIALAAFLLGYVVKDLGGEHRRPEFGPRIGVAWMQDGPGGAEARGLERGQDGFRAGVTAGTVTSVDGNTLTLRAPNGKSVKVTLDKDAFVVVRNSADK